MSLKKWIFKEEKSYEDRVEEAQRIKRMCESLLYLKLNFSYILIFFILKVFRQCSYNYTKESKIKSSRIRKEKIHCTKRKKIIRNRHETF